MELYFIKDKTTKIYYIKENKPFFYAFTNYEAAVQFCNSNPGSEIEPQTILSEEDDEFLTECIYQQGYKGGYTDGIFTAINQSNPQLMKFIPENAGLLNLTLYKNGDTNKKLLKEQRFYFFATITEDGYLAFANSNGYIFAFTDVDNIDTSLAKALYKKGYEAIKYFFDEEHKYIINANRPTQTIMYDNYSFLAKATPAD